MYITLLLFFSINAFSKNDNYFKLGEQFYFDKNFEIAKTFFIKALTQDPNNYKIYYYLGNIYYIEKDYEKALETFLDGLKFNKDLKVFYYNIGTCYHALKEYDKVRIVYTGIFNIITKHYQLIINLKALI